MTNASTATKTETALGKKPHESIDKFLKLSSFNDLLALYACVLSHKTKTPFNFKKITQLNSTSNDYSFAYIVASHAADIISYSLKKDIMTIKDVNQDIADKIQKSLESTIEDISGDEKDFEEKLTTLKESVENYFP